MKEELEKEKTELARQITVNEELIKTSQTQIYWLKKRLKLTEGQIKALPEEKSAGETLKEIAEGLSE
jgi:hypothetical protein